MTRRCSADDDFFTWWWSDGHTSTESAIDTQGNELASPEKLLLGNNSIDTGTVGCESETDSMTSCGLIWILDSEWRSMHDKIHRIGGVMWSYYAVLD